MAPTLTSTTDFGTRLSNELRRRRPDAQPGTMTRTGGKSWPLPQSQQTICLTCFWLVVVFIHVSWIKKKTMMPDCIQPWVVLALCVTGRGAEVPCARRGSLLMRFHAACGGSAGHWLGGPAACHASRTSYLKLLALHSVARHVGPPAPPGNEKAIARAGRVLVPGVPDIIENWSIHTKLTHGSKTL